MNNIQDFRTYQIEIHNPVNDGYEYDNRILSEYEKPDVDGELINEGLFFNLKKRTFNKAVGGAIQQWEETDKMIHDKMKEINNLCKKIEKERAKQGNGKVKNEVLEKVKKTLVEIDNVTFDAMKILNKVDTTTKAFMLKILNINTSNLDMFFSPIENTRLLFLSWELYTTYIKRQLMKFLISFKLAFTQFETRIYTAIFQLQDKQLEAYKEASEAIMGQFQFVLRDEKSGIKRKDQERLIKTLNTVQKLINDKEKGHQYANQDFIDDNLYQGITNEIKQDEIQNLDEEIQSIKDQMETVATGVAEGAWAGHMQSYKACLIAAVRQQSAKVIDKMTSNFLELCEFLKLPNLNTIIEEIRKGQEEAEKKAQKEVEEAEKKAQKESEDINVDDGKKLLEEISDENNAEEIINAYFNKSEEERDKIDIYLKLLNRKDSRTSELSTKGFKLAKTILNPGIRWDSTSDSNVADKFKTLWTKIADADAKYVYVSSIKEEYNVLCFDDYVRLNESANSNDEEESEYDENKPYLYVQEYGYDVKKYYLICPKSPTSYVKDKNIKEKIKKLKTEEKITMIVPYQVLNLGGKNNVICYEFLHEPSMSGVDVEDAISRTMGVSVSRKIRKYTKSKKEKEDNVTIYRLRELTNISQMKLSNGRGETEDEKNILGYLYYAFHEFGLKGYKPEDFLKNLAKKELRVGTDFYSKLGVFCELSAKKVNDFVSNATKQDK